MKALLGILILFVFAAAVGTYFLNYGLVPSEAALPKLGKVEFGPIQENVKATGKLAPQGVRHVSTDVAAAIVRRLTDKAAVGAKVEKGDLLVELDDDLLQAKLSDARALVKVAEAGVKEAQAGVDEASEAKEGTNKLLTTAQTALENAKNPKKPNEPNPDLIKHRQADFDKVQLNYKVAERALLRAEAALERANGSVNRAKAGVTSAQIEVGHTKIHAPVSGTVIEKKIITGQIITPQNVPILFVIAPDLNKLEIKAKVGEADIAKIKNGMEAMFTVDAYPNVESPFKAKVTDVSIVPDSSGGGLPGLSGLGGLAGISLASGSGPVFYTVTLEVDTAAPKEGINLKPGLTANVDFIVKKEDKALLIPNQALSYRPEGLSEEEKVEIDKKVDEGLFPLWVWKGDRTTRLAFVKTGATDGMRTEILVVDDGELSENMELVLEDPPKRASIWDKTISFGI